MRITYVTAGVVLALLAACMPAAETADQLPSWNDGPVKQAIVQFVQQVTDPTNPEFIPDARRVAVFDNDGTLWAEQPMYVQLAFAIDRIRTMADAHPEWQHQPPYAGILSGDSATLAALSMHDVSEIVTATHSGMTTDEFRRLVSDWLRTARHPRFDRPYTDLAYQPMLELLAFLRANEFRTYIVSGGGIDFMRAFTEEVYGIPPEQVVGSMGALRFELRDSTPVLIKEPGVEFVDDGPGKPIGIERFVGRRPIAAAGNSDGDLQMLQYTAADPGSPLTLLVHHDDAAREWAYDRASSIGHLDKALDAARARDWTVVSMKNDWSVVFAFEKGPR